MEDAEVIDVVGTAVGAPASAARGARVVPLSGKQGLLIGRVILGNGRTYIFKAIKESACREVRIAALLSHVAPTLVPRVYGSEEDPKRGLYWLVCEDVGPRRLSDSPTVDGYVAAAVALARLQIAALEHESALRDSEAPVVDAGRWEEIALRALEAAGGLLTDSGLCSGELESVIWSVTALTLDASICPTALIHGDLHGGNVAVCPADSDAAPLTVRILDWGSAYLGAAFLGLEELLFPAARHLRAPEQRLRVRAAYLREWSPLLGKPGHLEKAVLACETLVRLELLDEAQRRPHLYDTFALTAIERRLIESYSAWRRA